MSAIDRIGVNYSRISVEGTEYVVTTGTGEMSYGSEGGGSAAFAYDAEDVDALGEDIQTYQDFCDAIDPETDRDLAIVLAAQHDLRLTCPGACTPVLSDEEWALVRRVVEVAS